MEKETLLVVLNSQKIENNSTALGSPEDHDDSNNIDHDDSNNIDFVPEQEDENDRVEDEDNKGVVSVSIKSYSK